MFVQMFHDAIVMFAADSVVFFFVLEAMFESPPTCLFPQGFDIHPSSEIVYFLDW